MIAWLNFSVLVVSSVLFSFYYVWSVRPAALEHKVGRGAYGKCARHRRIASLFMLIRYGTAYGEYMDRVGFWFPKKRKMAESVTSD